MKKKQRAVKKHKRRQGRIWFPALVVFLGLAGAALLRYGIVVRSIQVVGNRNIPKEEIIELSGVHPGDSYPLLSTAQLRRRLETNRYIEYLGREYNYKGTLTLKIHERTGMGTVNVLGLYYVLDDTGMILECTGLERAEGISGPAINGLRINEGFRMAIGETLPVRDSYQLEQMKSVLKALYEANMLARVTELNVQQSDNIYLMTREGARIILGDDSNLMIKLLIAREVLSIRKEQGGLYGSRIDVSSGSDAHFIPDVLPTMTPTPTATPTVAPEETPKK